MKTTLILTTAVLVFSGMQTCRANLGMTAEQVEKTFNKPVASQVKGGQLIKIYETDNYHLIVVYEEGIAINETLHSQRKGSNLSDSNCVAMAALLCGEVKSRWSERPELDDATSKTWSVGTAFYAMRARTPGAADMLMVRYGDDKDEIASKLELCKVPLGKTMADFEANYGKPKDSRKDESVGLFECIYEYKKQHLVVGYLDGVALVETLPSADKDVRLSGRMCLAAARAITGATNWHSSTNGAGLVEGRRYWDAGKDFSAVRIVSKVRGDSLTVVNERSMKALKNSSGPKEVNTANSGDTGGAQQPAGTGDAKQLKMQQEWAEQGDAYGQYKMGIRYLTGDGVEKNEKKGRDLLQKSADQGNGDAKAALAKLPKQ